MHSVSAIVFLVAVVTVANCAPQSRMDYLVNVLRRLEQARQEEKAAAKELQDYIKGGVVHMSQRREKTSSMLKIQQPFTWKNCGPPDSVVILKNATLTPSPVPLPGNIQYGLTMEFKEVVGATDKVAFSLLVKKKIGDDYVTIPCIGELGSCTWGNACAFDPLPNPCPNNFPCHCPFPNGTYTIPLQSAYLNPSGLPSWLTSGDYQVQGSLSTNGKTLGCVYAQLSLS